MLSWIDRSVVFVCTVVVVSFVALPAAIETPMFARCTQAALDRLERADPQDRRPPPWLVAAIVSEVGEVDLPLAAARMTMWNSRCNGPSHHSVLRLYETIGLSIWWRLRLDRDQIVALYVTQAWLGTRPMGFSAASRRNFGKELSALTPDEQRCLIARLRSTDPRRFRCEADGRPQARRD